MLSFGELIGDSCKRENRTHWANWNGPCLILSMPEQSIQHYTMEQPFHTESVLNGVPTIEKKTPETVQKLSFWAISG